MNELQKRSSPNPAKASLWYVVCSVVQKGVSLLLVPMYIRLMTTEEYGVYTLAQSWEGILLVFTTLNLAAYAFNNCLIQNEEKREKVTGAFCGLIISLTIICIVIFVLFHDFWEQVFNLKGKYILLIILESCFIVVTDLWYARKKFDYSYHEVVVVTIGISLMNLMAGILFVSYVPEKAFAALLAGAGARGLATIVLVFDIWRKGHCFFEAGFWKYALCFNIPLIPHFLSSRILQQADRVMIEKSCGAAQAGIYGFSYKITEAMLIFNTAFLASVTPWTYRKLKEKKYNEIFSKVFLTILLIGGLNLALIFLAPEIIAVLGTSEYKEAVYIIPPVACSTYLMYLFNCFVNITYFYEENKKITGASILAACLNIYLNWLLIPKYGYLAAAYTTLASYACLAIMHGFMQKSTLKKNEIKVNIYHMPVLISFSVFYIAIGVSSSFLYDNRWIRYGVLVVLLIVLILKRDIITEMLRTAMNKNIQEDMK